MLSVRNEWLLADTAEKKLEWTNKWGDLLMEDFQNPIWVSGHTQALKETYDLIKKIEDGQTIRIALPEQLERYKNAVNFMNTQVKTATCKVKVEASALENIDAAYLRKVAADNLTPAIVKHMHVEEEELANGDMSFSFTVVMLDDDE